MIKHSFADQYPLIDFEGKYGMTQVVFGLKVGSKKEAEGIKKAIDSERFRKIIVCADGLTYDYEFKEKE
jgi:NAD(P)H-hydrate repair Nnr-like enzyme with NAD(P)H-hydrate dehydratase domain